MTRPRQHEEPIECFPVGATPIVKIDSKGVKECKLTLVFTQALAQSAKMNWATSARCGSYDSGLHRQDDQVLQRSDP